MKMIRIGSFVTVVASALWGLGARHAYALALPDSGSCSSSPCLKITNTAGGNALEVDASGSFAVWAYNSKGIALVGTTNSVTAIWGLSTTSYGVFGQSSSGTGVAGWTSPSTSGNAIFGDAGGSYAAWAGNFSGDVVGRDFFGNSFNPSDARLKKDIKDAPYGLKEVMKLRPVTYQWKDPQKHGAGIHVGLIAQEVREFIPEVVKDRGGKGELALGYIELVPVLVKAVQQQQAIIEAQGREIAGLRSERRAGALSSSSAGSLGIGASVAFLIVPFGLLGAHRLRRRR